MQHTGASWHSGGSCDAARVANMAPQKDLPQVSHRLAVAKAVRTPARKLMPSAGPENALRWPRRETAAGPASARI